MANALKGEVQISAAGQNWTLVLDFNALCEFEDLTGKKALPFLEQLEAADEDDGVEVSLKDIRAMLLATMLEHHPEATLKDAGKLLGEDNGILMQALAAAAPEAETGGDTSGES